MTYVAKTAKELRAILASDPSQAPAILKFLQDIQRKKNLQLPRALLAYELAFGHKPVGQTLKAVREAIIKPVNAPANVPAQAAAMTTLPTPRTPKAPAKPQPKAEGTITVSQFEAIMTAMSNAAVAELRKQLG